MKNNILGSLLLVTCALPIGCAADASGEEDGTTPTVLDPETDSVLPQFTYRYGNCYATPQAPVRVTTSIPHKLKAKTTYGCSTAWPSSYKLTHGIARSDNAGGGFNQMLNDATLPASSSNTVTGTATSLPVWDEYYGTGIWWDVNGNPVATCVSEKRYCGFGQTCNSTTQGSGGCF